MTAAGAAEQTVASAINRAAGGRPIPGNQVDLLIDGPCAYDAMLDVISGATRWIHFENYIIRDDIRRGADEIGVPLEAHISFLLTALRPHEHLLGLGQA